MTKAIDARSTRRHPARTDAMRPLQGLLLQRLDLYWHDVRATGGLEERTGIGRIGLVPLHVGPDIRCRQQLDRDAQPIEPAAPMMG